ncbi:dephospho-CoA kinase [Bacteroides heparinolyticus]|uniref:dephospho-CoA kinase n=1 Tax=Prevotella heparinolytica TaxID=28113 RepID=UPI0035A0E898
MNKQIVLGITGGIGSGKSYIAAILKDWGIPIFDTDIAAKNLINTSDIIRIKLITLLGEEVYLPSGELNRQVLAQYLFASQENAIRVNDIVHPHVYNAFESWRASLAAPIVGMETAILFESGFDKFVDVSLTVIAPLELRIKRVMVRDSISEVEVCRRISVQMSDEERLKKSDYYILNDEGNSLKSRLESLLVNIKARFS